MALEAVEYEPQEPALGSSLGYPQVVSAFSEVAHAISEKGDLDSLLHLVAEKICGLLDIRRCSVYLRDQQTNLFRGQVAEVGADVDAAIKRLTAGMEADGFTREILATKQPVLIVNAQSDPRPVRSAMIEWDVQTMLGVPMLLRGDVIGILFLDNMNIPHEYSPEEQELSATFANLAAIAISQAQLTRDLRSSLGTVAQQNAILRRAAALEDRLTTLVLEGADLRGIARAVTELTGKPCAIHDADGKRLTHASTEGAEDLVPRIFEPGRQRDPVLREALQALTPRRPSVIGPIPSAGLQHRFLVAAVQVGDDNWGYLVLMEYPSRFGAQDMIVARRTATIIALELSAERRAAEAESHATEALARDLIHASDEPSSLARRADFHGLALTEPHVVCLVTLRDEGVRRRLSSRRVAEAFAAAAPDLRAFVAGVEKGAAVVLELPSAPSTIQAIRAAKAVAENVLAQMAPDRSATAALSTACSAPEDYPAAYEQARQVSRCISTFGAPGHADVLSADDLGAGQLLLANADPREVERFVATTLNALLDSDDATTQDLLLTLQGFFSCSRSVRRSAALLDVHENTIRYRLARVQDITGLDIVGNGDDQLAAQLALLVLRLQGALPAPAPSDVVELANGEADAGR